MTAPPIALSTAYSPKVPASPSASVRERNDSETAKSHSQLASVAWRWSVEMECGDGVWRCVGQRERRQEGGRMGAAGCHGRACGSSE